MHCPQKGKPPTAWQWEVPQKGFRKKRGRKEVLRRRKAADHGFRDLSGYSVNFGFERGVTQMKTIFDFFMNKPPRKRLPERRKNIYIFKAKLSISGGKA